MLRTVYITKITKFLPNKPIQNDEMEDYLGKINGFRSRAKAIVLRNNGIKTRYYALDKQGKSTHTNAELTAEAIKKLEDKNFSIKDIELLTSGSSSPDQMLPSHSSMVHGLLDINAIDVMTASGGCNSAMWAFNYACMSIQTGKLNNAVCTGSEKLSTWMTSKNFEEESKQLEALGENPYIAFEREFLRWMLSDGAAAALLQPEPNKKDLSLRIDWIDIRSYANQVETCMYSGGSKTKDGSLKPWRNMNSKEWMGESVFSLQQDSRLLEKHITQLGGEYLNDLIKKYDLDIAEIDYFLPHMSSEFFRKRIQESLIDNDIDIPSEKWFTNLERIGNIGAASGFLMLEELLYSGRLKKGNIILLMVPESARFSYTFSYLTVV